MTLMSRTLHEVNTDPQRRCYNGCHAKSENIWSEWEVLETVPEEKHERRLEFWQELNDYAVSQRGVVGTKSEFKAVE